MSLLLQQGFSEAANSASISIWDATGIYNAQTNLTGYGAPNPLSTAVTAAQFTFTFDDIANPMILNLVVANGVVTSGTFTDNLGNVTAIDLAEYNINLFPFTQVQPINLPASLFVSGATSFSDQYVTIQYQISVGSSDYTSTETWLMSANACCCLQKAWYKYAIGECQRQEPMKIQDAINGLNAANAVADLTTARESIVRLNQLCSACGCGCSGH